MTSLGATSQPCLARKAMLRHDRVRGAYLLLLPERVVRLNASSAAILERCDGSQTVEEIVTKLEVQFSASDLTDEVVSFLHDAVKHGWVVL